MECSKCKTLILKGEEREYKRTVLCEDCYMDALSPPVFCDPWATFSAESFHKNHPETVLTDNQKAIMNVLKETGGVYSNVLAAMLAGKISQEEGERECATLHRIDKILFENRDGSVFIRLK